MRTIDPGHSYSVQNYSPREGEDVIADCQFLRFFKRIGEGYPGNVGHPHDGTNLQEVYRMLIKRILYLNGQIPCRENEQIIEMARQSILLLEIRAAQRHGTTFPACLILTDIEDIPPCKTCGHIFKHEHEGLRHE